MTEPKRYRIEGTLLEVETIKPSLDDSEAIDEWLSLATPQGRISKIKPLAEKWAAGLAEIAEAEVMARVGFKTKKDCRIFTLLLDDAFAQIVASQNEAVLIPTADRDYFRQEGCREGGRNAGQTRREKSPRQRIVQTASKLLSEGRSRRGLAETLASRFGFTARYIRIILREEKI